MRKPDDKYDGKLYKAVQLLHRQIILLRSLAAILAFLTSSYLDEPFEFMLNALGVLVHQVDFEHVGRRIIAVVPQSFLWVYLCPFQDGMDACMLTIGVQEVVHPVTIPPLDDVHAHTEPLANVDVHHFDSHIAVSLVQSFLQQNFNFGHCTKIRKIRPLRGPVHCCSSIKEQYSRG